MSIVAVDRKLIRMRKLYDINVKVKFSLEHATKVQRGVEVHCTLSLNSTLDGGVWSTPCPGCFFPGKTWYLLYRRLGGPQGRYGRVRKNSLPTGFDPRTVQPVANHYTY
jgi:hypothetical protein